MIDMYGKCEDGYMYMYGHREKRQRSRDAAKSRVDWLSCPGNA